MLVAVLLGAGCGRESSSIVGSWRSGSVGAMSDYHFFPGGKFTMHTTRNGVTADVEGTYKIDGDRLVMAPTKSTVDGTNAALRAKLEPTLRQPSRVPMKWGDSDSLTLVMPKGPGLILTRNSTKP